MEEQQRIAKNDGWFCTEWIQWQCIINQPCKGFSIDFWVTDKRYSYNFHWGFKDGPGGLNQSIRFIFYKENFYIINTQFNFTTKLYFRNVPSRGYFEWTKNKCGYFRSWIINEFIFGYGCREDSAVFPWGTETILVWWLLRLLFNKV